MRCLGWALLVVLGWLRRANSLVAGSTCRRSHTSFSPGCNIRGIRSSVTSDSSLSSLCNHRLSVLGGAPRAEALTVRRRQSIDSVGDSGSTSELGTGAAAAAETDGITDAGDSNTTQGFTVFSRMELALDSLGRSTQWVVAGAVGVALLTRADVDTLVFVVGSLFNAVFSKVLKKTINQVRPEGAQLSDPGMPSSHAMSLFYLGTYLVIGLQEHGVLVLHPPLPHWPLGVAGTQMVLGIYAVAASLWRVKAGFHTLPQVLVGAAVGAVDATLWYYFCRVYFSLQVETFFGGTDIPVELAVGVCAATFLTFGNAQRKIADILARKKMI